MSNDKQSTPPPLRIAQVVPVAQSVPPSKSGSIETMTSLLVDGLVKKGHQVTLFATASSQTTGTLESTFTFGYNEDDSLWPWEFCEVLNVSKAIERSSSFDVIHCHAEYAPFSLAFQRVSQTPLVHTVHHSPTPQEVLLWQRYPEAPFIAISHSQARRLAELRVVGTVHHAVDITQFRFNPYPDDYLLFLGRFTKEKGVIEAIQAAKKLNLRLVLAAAENSYYLDEVAPLVDGKNVVYEGELDLQRKIELLGRARALLYPVQTDEPFGLVIAESMSCGTPVAALNRGAVSELIQDGYSGGIFNTMDDLVDGLHRVTTLDRAAVRTHAVSRFSPDKMVDDYLAIYRKLARELTPTVASATEPS